MTAYNEQQWLDGPAGGTPLSGTRLTHMETGIGDSLPVPVGVKEGDIVRKTDVGWEAVPADAYLSNSAVVIQGILTSPSNLPQFGTGGDGYLVQDGDEFDLHIWVDPEWLNTGPMNNIQGPPGLRGVQGPPGAGLRVLGSLAAEGDLATVPTPETGDAYIITQNLWVWDGTAWNNTGNVGLFDHSALAGLTNDDHPQYALVDGTRTVTVGPVAPVTPEANDIWGRTTGDPVMLRWSVTDSAWLPLSGQANSTVYTQDVLANLPAAAPSIEGSWFWAADDDELYYCDGFTWHLLNETITHNQIKGLDADDHPQYLTEARGNDRYLKLTGGVLTGHLTVPNIKVGASTLASSGTATLDFAGAGFLNQGPLTGNITYATSNMETGKTVTVRVRGGTVQCSLAFPAQWAFIGVKPSSLAANKTGVLSVACFGSTASDLVAAWSFEL